MLLTKNQPKIAAKTCEKKLQLVLGKIEKNLQDVLATKQFPYWF